jgi:hypothetical protein
VIAAAMFVVLIRQIAAQWLSRCRQPSQQVLRKE